MKASEYRSIELIEIDSAADGLSSSNINNANNNCESNDEAQLLQNQQQLTSSSWPSSALPSLSKIQWLLLSILTIMNTILLAIHIMHPWEQQGNDSRVEVNLLFVVPQR